MVGKNVAKWDIIVKLWETSLEESILVRKASKGMFLSEVRRQVWTWFNTARPEFNADFYERIDEPSAPIKAGSSCPFL
jgi:hypothetical protein